MTNHTRPRFLMTRALLALVGAVFLLPANPSQDATAAGLEALDTEEWVVIVHKDNDADLNTARIRDIFLRRATKWGDGSAIEVYQAEENTPQRGSFAREVLEMSPEKELQYWVEARIRDGLVPPRVRSSTRVVRVFVSRKKNAIGYIPASEADEKVRIVHRFNVEK